MKKDWFFRTAKDADIGRKRPKFELRNRAVDITQIEFEHGEYAQAVEAYYIDTGADLTEKEIERINEKYAAKLYEEAYINAASAAYDRAKDLRKYGE